MKGTKLEIMKHSFTAVPEQMGMALQKSAHSPNIKERKDESCALFTADKEMLAQAEHIPVHLGAMPSALDEAVEEREMKKGDQVILNDPYAGGTHLPDITVIKPVFLETEHIGYVVNRAHHADVGGKIPGSMPGESKRLEEEGIVVPPTHLVRDGEFEEGVIEKFEDARSPGERRGDLRAQVGANEKGAREMKKNVRKFGIDDYVDFAESILEYSEKRARECISSMPSGEYTSRDTMEWKEDVELKVKVVIGDEGVRFDFSGTEEQVKGNINAPLPVTLSAVYYILRCLMPDDVPVNNGVYRTVEVDVPQESLLNPRPPAAVSAGNVETSQRVVELVLRALSKAMPDEIPAESQGTMNNLAIGNEDFTYYETIGGGTGASSEGDGASGVQVHMTNTKNTPVEALENEYPLRVHKYRLREDSGGEGFYSGGDGIFREIEMMADVYLSLQSDRRRHAPKGVNGGGDGKKGVNTILKGGERKGMTGKFTTELREGDRVIVETPGGGGWGEEED